MRILFVAPTAELATISELGRVASGNTISVLDGIVDRRKLELALGDGQFDVVHFAQHGSRAGLELSDGVIEVGDLVSMLQPQTRLRLLFVNACNSAATGIELHNAFHVPVVAHDALITDKAAVAFAETFYRALRTAEIREAFSRALRTLQVRFPDEARTPQLINGDMASLVGLTEIRNEIREAFQGIYQRLDKVEATMNALDCERADRRQRLELMLLVALLLAQILTPIVNGMLIHP